MSNNNTLNIMGVPTSLPAVAPAVNPASNIVTADPGRILMSETLKENISTDEVLASQSIAIVILDFVKNNQENTLIGTLRSFSYKNVIKLQICVQTHEFFNFFNEKIDLSNVFLTKIAIHLNQQITEYQPKDGNIFKVRKFDLNQIDNERGMCVIKFSIIEKALHTAPPIPPPAPGTGV